MTPEQERALAAMAQAPSMRAARVWELDPFSPPEPEPPPPTAPSMRAATWMETLRDRLAQAFEALAQQPGVQAAGKAMGQVAPVLEEATYGNLRPGTGWQIGMMPDLPGQVPGMPGFYSRLDRAVATLPNKPVHPNAVLNAVKGKASQEEVQWRRLAEFLSGKTQVTRAEVEDWLAQHPLSLETAQKGTPRVQMYSITRDAETGKYRISTQRGEPLPDEALHDTTNEAIARVRELQAEQAVGSPKFAQYQVPGGEAYRETLTTLKQEDRLQQLVAARDKVQAETDAAMRGKDRFAPYPPELVERYNALQRQIDDLVTKQQFASGHWDESNVLGHTRENERTLPTGERGLFVEEMQSDWHQKGKAQGYKLPPEVTAPMDAEYRALVHKNAAAREAGQQPLEQDIARAKHLEEQLMRADASKIPDAPFKDTWDDLLFKQRLLEAAQRDDLDWVGWTTGETQADRYSLSKHFSEIHYSGTNLKGYDHQGREVVSKTGVSEAELPEYIGQEAAQRLLAQPKQGTLRSLTGLDLKVGGEGMHEFYDKRRVARAEKTVKPFGGAVEQAPVAANVPDVERFEHGRRMSAVEPKYTPAWLVRLPPEMKAKIREQGLPLLSVLALLSAQGLKPQPSHEVAR